MYLEGHKRGNIGDYWFADIELLEKMVKGVKQIYQVKTWLQFFVNVVFARDFGFVEGDGDGEREECCYGPAPLETMYNIGE